MDKYDYDISVDAFSLERQEYNYAYSIEITENLIIDVDQNENLVAIELLNASKELNIKPEQLVNPRSIYAEVSKSDDSINLLIKFELEDMTRELDVPLFNDINLKNNTINSI